MRRFASSRNQITDMERRHDIGGRSSDGCQRGSGSSDRPLHSLLRQGLGEAAIGQLPREQSTERTTQAADTGDVVSPHKDAGSVRWMRNSLPRLLETGVGSARQSEAAARSHSQTWARLVGVRAGRRRMPRCMPSQRR